jgi:hypothetical protein
LIDWRHRRIGASASYTDASTGDIGASTGDVDV